jgi:heme/copper-type cytochrome/quinol oxidase subunit 2
MRGKVVVVDQKNYNEWLSKQKSYEQIASKS